MLHSDESESSSDDTDFSLHSDTSSVDRLGFQARGSAAERSLSDFSASDTGTVDEGDEGDEQSWWDEAAADASATAGVPLHQEQERTAATKQHEQIDAQERAAAAMR
eukprot:SAG31_NODE_1401_length_8497_cov_4.386640_9_plen_106_part_01